MEHYGSVFWLSSASRRQQIRIFSAVLQCFLAFNRFAKIANLHFQRGSIVFFGFQVLRPDSKFIFSVRFYSVFWLSIASRKYQMIISSAVLLPLSDSLHKLVPNFLKKCTQFTKSLNWLQTSNLSKSLRNSFSSDSLYKLVTNFLSKCTQFTKSLNWLQASNLLVYWFREYGFTYPTLQMAKRCLKRSLFDDKNVVFWMVLGFRNSSCGGLERIGPTESFSNSLSKFITNPLPNSFSSDSLHKLVPKFVKKCTQFTKSLNWFQASNL